MGERTQAGYWVFPEVLALIDQAHVEGVEKGTQAGYEAGYDDGYERGRRAVRWYEVLFYLSSAFAFLVCGAFWLGRYFA